MKNSATDEDDSRKKQIAPCRQFYCPYSLFPAIILISCCSLWCKALSPLPHDGRTRVDLLDKPDTTPLIIGYFQELYLVVLCIRVPPRDQSGWYSWPAGPWLLSFVRSVLNDLLWAVTSSNPACVWKLQGAATTSRSISPSNKSVFGFLAAGCSGLGR